MSRHSLSQTATHVSDVLSSSALHVLNALQGIQYGSVEVTIHDGRIVQIERKEKLRLDQPVAARQ
ncbi:MAG: DUF2292 domain-containing protein [Methylococcaceae bacterium]|nr:MAG: DUF2292 domain-containing protein [Methylococcaceae bacterium]